MHFHVHAGTNLLATIGCLGTICWQTYYSQTNIQTHTHRVLSHATLNMQSMCVLGERGERGPQRAHRA